MRRFMVYVTDETAVALEHLAKRCSDSNARHAAKRAADKVTVEHLLQILADDLGVMQQRPESQEAINMKQVLRAHGYRDI